MVTSDVSLSAHSAVGRIPDVDGQLRCYSVIKLDPTYTRTDVIVSQAGRILLIHVFIYSRQRLYHSPPQSIECNSNRRTQSGRSLNHPRPPCRQPQFRTATLLSFSVRGLRNVWTTTTVYRHFRRDWPQKLQGIINILDTQWITVSTANLV